MSEKWTHGPWECGEDMRGTMRVFAGRSEIVTAKALHGQRRLSPEERKANANLIAAAPDMAKALERILSPGEYYGEVNGAKGSTSFFISWDDIRFARAALAKARGEG